MRVGLGYDVHKLVEDRKLIIGGVEIPYEKGLLGHSDADVLLHAIMDALLGAAALGDIGKHFPDTDAAYKGISSIKLLEEVGVLLDKNNYFIISSTKHNYLGESTINPKRMVCPYINEDEKQWDFYNKWLSATLAKKLLVIEIGEGFNNPNLIRWPFERIVMINDKAHFYRVHSTFYQIPKEIADKACTMKINSYEVLKELVNVVN